MRKPFALGIVYCKCQPLHLYSLISKDMDNILPLAPTSPVYLFLIGSAKIRNGQFLAKWGEMGNFWAKGGEMGTFWAKWA